MGHPQAGEARAPDPSPAGLITYYVSSDKSFSLSRPQCHSLKVKALSFFPPILKVEQEPVKLVGVVTVSGSWLDQL